MKKFLTAVLLLIIGVVPVFAGRDEIVGSIPPGNSTSNVTIAAPGTDKQNCLTFLNVSISTYGANVTRLMILDGLASATTVYSLALSTTTGLQTPNPIAPRISSEDPYCVSSNNALQIKNTSSVFDINYQGYVRRTR